MALEASNTTAHAPQSRPRLVLPSAPLLRHTKSAKAWRGGAIVQPHLTWSERLPPSRSAADSTDKKWADVSEFLAVELELTPMRIQKIVSRDPSLATASIDAELKPNLSTLRCLGARPASVRRMAERTPQLLRAPLLPWVDFLTNYGIQSRGVLDILDHHPEVVIRGSIFEAGRVLLFLKDLGLTDRVILNLVIPKWPDLLARNVEIQMAPFVDALHDLLGDKRAVKGLVSRSPWLLRFDVSERLDPTLFYLHHLGFRDEEVRQLVSTCLSILVADVERCLKPKVSFLASLGLNAQEVKRVVLACPQIFEFTIENMDRKWRFLANNMDGGTSDLLRFPYFFSKSLLREIGPRHSYVTTHRHVIDASCPIFTSLGDIDLEELLHCSDTEFCAKVKCALQDFEFFQVRWVNEAGLRWSGVNAIGRNDLSYCWSE